MRRLKILLVGGPGSGKSHVVYHHLTGGFDLAHSTTSWQVLPRSAWVPVDYIGENAINVPSSWKYWVSNNLLPNQSPNYEMMEVHIWVQAENRVLPEEYENVDMVVICFSVGDRGTFTDIPYKVGRPSTLPTTRFSHSF